MEWDDDKGVRLEVEAGRIDIYLQGYKTPRSMALEDCAAVSLYMAPKAGPLGMTVSYRTELTSARAEPGIAIGDTVNLKEARALWQRAAQQLGKPSRVVTPDGAAEGDADPGLPPRGITCSEEGGKTRVRLRRGMMEYIIVGALAVGLGVVLAFGERQQDDDIFLLVAAGLFVYAITAGLSARFLEIADGRLTAGLRTPLGEFARVEMPMAEVDVVFWGKEVKGFGGYRSAFAVATADHAKCFDRLREDQARWLGSFVRKAVKG